LQEDYFDGIHIASFGYIKFAKAFYYIFIKNRPGRVLGKQRDFAFTGEDFPCLKSSMFV